MAAGQGLQRVEVAVRCAERIARDMSGSVRVPSWTEGECSIETRSKSILSVARTQAIQRLAGAISSRVTKLNVAGCPLTGSTRTGPPLGKGKGQKVHSWKYSKDETDLDGLIALAKMVRRSRITDLNLAETHLGPHESWTSLKKDPPTSWLELEKLCTSKNALSLLTLSSVGKQSQSTLYTLCTSESLNLDGSCFGLADSALLAAWVSRPQVLKVLRSLHVQDNPGLMGEVNVNGTLRQSDVHANGDGPFAKLCTALNKAGHLTDIDVARCGLGPVGVSILSEYIGDPGATVQRVCVSGNYLFGEYRKRGEASPSHNAEKNKKDDGWRALCDAVHKSNSLTELIAADVGMGPQGAQLLSAAVVQSSLLTLTVDSTGHPATATYTLRSGSTVLDLSSKSLACDDGLLLASWLGKPAVSESLASLSLHSNPGLVGDTNPTDGMLIPDAHPEVVAKICSALKHSHCAHVEVSGCGLGPVALANIANHVEENEHLRHLSLSDNPLCGDDASWDALCNAVKASSSLEELALSGIGLDKEDSQDTRRWRLKNKMESATVANSVREGVKLELS